ncbi:hypothetical protein HCH_03974 [Hahella chejuensis KCTC 2396]|uniref:Uncharacterized protein n=1 Tax=Hahella chejuensis (strain KCTC 2396) TaxID=349521 RepID=Q2SF81_HAHCH|nr:hypothetical protein HCH_03974 [Hahella chejuensis KCTC 2396]
MGDERQSYQTPKNEFLGMCSVHIRAPLIINWYSPFFKEEQGFYYAHISRNIGYLPHICKPLKLKD